MVVTDARALHVTKDPARVRAMFARISPRYDLFNRLATFGLDGYWRRRAAGGDAWTGTGCALDVGAGTGAFTNAVARRAQPGALVVGTDPCPEMLGRARARRGRRGYRGPRFVLGRAEELAFGSGRFEWVGLAFVLRDLPDPGVALREIRRVLKPGGALSILEATPAEGHWMRGLQRWYLRRCVPLIGRLVSGERWPFEFLAESVLRFPRAAEMARVLGEAGFADVRRTPLTGGLVTVYRATKRGAA